ncbi:MAG: thiamine pyrophosphate-binding protein, partial [Chloroflexi bacterium]|nr:thiamine pyrophosphate-binding protein [Chloroflexota bacterium]
MPQMTGKRALWEMLKVEGVEYVFGLPGSSESPILDALEDFPDFKYILGLHEGTIIGMADGYARATGRVSYVGLHIEAGLANGLGLMQDAKTSGTPMVVTSANYDVRKVAEGKVDLAKMAEPFTKWSVELSHPEQIPSVMRRAFHEANTYPKGPVYVGLTANALDGVADMNLVPSSPIYGPALARSEEIDQAATALLGASRALMVVGDRVADSDAVGEAVRVSETLGIPVYAARGGEINFPTDHPQFMSRFSSRLGRYRDLLRGADVVLVAGADTFKDLFYQSDVMLPASSTLIHIDPSVSEVGKSEPTDIGIVADIKLALGQLTETLGRVMTPDQVEAAGERAKRVTEASRTAVEEREEAVRARWDGTPMSPGRMFAELAACLPDDVVIANDSYGSSEDLMNAVTFKAPGDLHSTRGASTGWGMGGAIGLKIGYPDRPVVAVIGDGTGISAIQALWTAKNDAIPVVYVICNNAMFRLLKLNMNT